MEREDYTITELKSSRKVSLIISFITLVGALYLLSLACYKLFLFLNNPSDLGKLSGGLYVLALPAIFSGVVAYIIFIVWFKKTYSQMESIRIEGLKYSKWKVTGFIIPVINILMPCLLVSELWKASNPEKNRNNWLEGKSSPIIYIWWILLIAWGSFFAIGVSSTGSESRLSSHIFGVTFFAITTIYIFLNTFLINKITSRLVMKISDLSK